MSVIAKVSDDAFMAFESLKSDDLVVIFRLMAVLKRFQSEIIALQMVSISAQSKGSWRSVDDGRSKCG